MATCSKEKAAASRKPWNNQGKWRHAITSQSKNTTLVALIIQYVTICLEGLADVVAFYWLTSMVENNP
jgi:hypothetical protein